MGTGRNRMAVISKRHIDPSSGEVTVSFTSYEISKIFRAGSHLDLWYMWAFDDKWNSLSDIEKLDVVMVMVKLAGSAMNLNLSAGEPEPK